jgi:hypothetical protein
MYSARIEAINLRQIEFEPDLITTIKNVKNLSELAETVSVIVCGENVRLLNGYDLVVTYKRVDDGH